MLMAHIHTKPGQHDHTASAFVVRLDQDKPKIMLHLHKKLGKYLQFGGHIELHETPWQTVAHELREESGYDLSQLEVLQPKERVATTSDTRHHPTPITYNTHDFGLGLDHYHTDVGFALVTSEPPTHTPVDGESRDFKLLDLDELKSLSSNLIADNVRASSIFALTSCLSNWERIPATDYTI